jgi:hypothetical protein
MTGFHLSISTWTAGSIDVVEIAGTLFLPQVPRVMAEITSVLRKGRHGVVVVDVSRLDAHSDSTLALFPAVLRRCGGWPHVALHLAAPPPDLRRSMLRFRMQRYLPVHSTLDAALTSAGADIATQRWQVAMNPEPAYLPSVRTAVRDLWPTTSRPRRDEAVLVVNELTTNAMRHVAQPFTVFVSASRTGMLLAVTDPGRQEPVLRPLRSAATDGRGMQLVDSLSDTWGVRLVHPQGKTVWAAMGFTPSAHRPPHSRSSPVG